MRNKFCTYFIFQTYSTVIRYRFFGTSEIHLLKHNFCGQPRSERNIYFAFKGIIQRNLNTCIVEPFKVIRKCLA